MDTDLRTVSTLKTTILQIKELDEDQTVGYSRRGVLTRRSRIAAIPIGYADGLTGIWAIEKDLLSLMGGERRLSGIYVWMFV
ncbi:MAG: alanine racemase C-terminal domain-containing protein [Coprobacter fastidiosus]